MEQIRLKAYGKINLGLDVIGKRENGYHDVRMIMQTVQLFDRLIMTKKKQSDITITTNLPYVPCNEYNLVYKAIDLLRKEFHIKEGVDVILDKHIPVSAGMAGGSSDCATALYGMNMLFSLGLSMEQLMEYGVTLGADVPYCLMRGTALSEGIGEILTQIPPMPHCYIVIIKPTANVSTKLVYENLKWDQIKEHPDIDGMITMLKNQNLKGVASRLGNVLEEVTIEKYPMISWVKEDLVKLGALNSLMSGSGSTVFGIFDNLTKAKNALYHMRKKKIVKQSYLVEPFNVKAKNRRKNDR